MPSTDEGPTAIGSVSSGRDPTGPILGAAMVTLSPTVRRWWQLPIRWWWRSLPFRVVASVSVASALILMLGGVLLMFRASQGVLAGKEQTSVAQAQAAVDAAQQRLDDVDLTTPTDVSDLLTQLGVEISNGGSSSGQYEVVLFGPVSKYRSGQASTESVPQALRDEVSGNNGLYSVPTLVRYDDGRTAPGLAIGSSLTVPGERYEVYFIFPLTQEVQTLEVLQSAAILTGALLVVMLTLIAALVSRQVVTPVRAARQAAERLASGNLDDRMKVRGTDDLARLATSMNYMASELQKQITQLEELSRVQQRFVSDVSHELRTPLTTVRMAAEVLHEAREDFDPVAARSAELLQTELDRFEALLTDLLEISRFDAGAAVLSLDQVDLRDVVNRVVDANLRFASAAGSEINVHASGTTTAEVDSRRIERIMRNLVVNAIEHGEGRPIDITIEGDETAVAIAVRDHGVGFEANQARQVFHRFWRADPARARTMGGTGLGLSISMEDARLHGGWMNAWGRPGMGAQFRLTLPRKAGAILEQSPLPLVPRDLVGPSVTRLHGLELARPLAVSAVSTSAITPPTIPTAPDAAGPTPGGSADDRYLLLPEAKPDGTAPTDPARVGPPSTGATGRGDE
ncbi:two-component system sensor histidine kinase MtrB [Microlunatus panaciterrae]|uniref:Sensor histidine kinase MtrB n=1 Tax=Microlunatus panaciterrae TaxID=400768 RepID=A0ABS2REW3_9ACTN|nr:two-component system sensor histidine kinase MtrB [Microlunatus panaciterrae]